MSTAFQQQEISYMSPEQVERKIGSFKAEIKYLKNTLTDQAALSRLTKVEQRVAELETIIEKHRGKNSN